MPRRQLHCCALGLCSLAVAVRFRRSAAARRRAVPARLPDAGAAAEPTPSPCCLEPAAWSPELQEPRRPADQCLALGCRLLQAAIVGTALAMKLQALFLGGWGTGSKGCELQALPGSWRGLWGMKRVRSLARCDQLCLRLGPALDPVSATFTIISC